MSLAELAVLLEVVVGAVGDALKLAPAHRGVVLDVEVGLGIVGQRAPSRCSCRRRFSDRMPRLFHQAMRSFDPVLVPLVVCARLDEELDLHLLELAVAEDEVARRDLVAERLADLGDAEGQLLAPRLLTIGEVDEDALRRLRAAGRSRRIVLDDAVVGLQHHVELARRGPRAAGAAVGAGDRLVDVDRVGVVDALLGRVVLLQVVLAEALVAGLALGQRVAEGAQGGRWPPRSSSAGSRWSRDRRRPHGQWTIERHHWRLMFSFSSTPSGP